MKNKATKEVAAKKKRKVTIPGVTRYKQQNKIGEGTKPVLGSILRSTFPLFKKNRTNTYSKSEPLPLSQKMFRHAQLEQLQVGTLSESDEYDDPNHIEIEDEGVEEYTTGLV